MAAPRAKVPRILQLREPSGSTVCALRNTIRRECTPSTEEESVGTERRRSTEHALYVYVRTARGVKHRTRDARGACWVYDYPAGRIRTIEHARGWSTLEEEVRPVYPRAAAGRWNVALARGRGNVEYVEKIGA